MAQKMLTASEKKKRADELKLIDEQVNHVTLELVEGTGDKQGRIFARGEFGHAGKPTANGRLYPPPIWESNIGRLRPNLKERKVLGELDHPSDGRTALQRASHVITDLRLEGDRVIGEAEILDTSMGRDLKAILEAGVPVGISSRGYGSTKPDGKGKEVVQEDYKLVTFDFVAEPADSTAYPEVFFEGAEFPAELEELMDESKKPDEATEEEETEESQETQESKGSEEESLEESVAARVSSMSDEEKELARKFLQVATGESENSEAPNMESLKKKFSSEILSHIGSMRGELEEEVRQDMLADPEIGGARRALEQVSRVLRPFLLPEDVNEVVEAKEEEIATLQRTIKERELKIGELEGLVETLAKAAKESGYKYHLERSISGESEADLIRSIVGDVTQYESAKEIDAKVEEAREQADSRRLEEEKVTRVSTARQSKLEEQARELAEGLEEAMGVNKQLALRLYASERLQTHPKAAKIHRMLEKVGFHSQDQIDDLIEEFREPTRDRDDLDSIRSRVRLRLQGGQEYLPEGHTHHPGIRPGGGDYNGSGLPLDQLKKLAGIDNR